LEVVTFINAARKIGAVAVPINYRLTDDEAAYVTDHCDATIVYVDAAYAPLYERIRDRLPQVDHYLVHSAGDDGVPDPRQHDGLSVGREPLDDGDGDEDAGCRTRVPARNSWRWR
jgi:acyl-CoA synthetase (AMP-forming)/AMP-acid ligase II